MKDFILENWKYGLWILFCSGFVFEIAPIKFSPITTILNWIGKRLNKDVETKISECNAKIDKVDAKVNTVQDDLQSHKIESWRSAILDFADALMRGENKTKEQFTYHIKLHNKYDKYIEERHLENGEIDLAFEFISDRYQEHMKNNNFYTGK